MVEKKADTVKNQMHLDPKLFRNVTLRNGRLEGELNVKLAEISVYNVRPNPTQAEQKEIKFTLGKSIILQGLQQIPVSNPKGEIFIGGRRLTAFKEIGRKWIPVEIRDLTPYQEVIASNTENKHRRNPDYMKQGRSYSLAIALRNQDPVSTKRTWKTFTATDLSRDLGVSAEYVTQRIRIYKTLSQYGVRTLSFEQARILSSSSIPDDKTEELIRNLESGELDTSGLVKITGKTKIAEDMLGFASTEVKEKVEPLHKDTFYSDKLDLDRLEYDIAKAGGGNLPLKAIKVDVSYFKDESEARAFAKRCGGRLLKKESFWNMEIDLYRCQDEMKNAKKKKR